MKEDNIDEKLQKIAGHCEKLNDMLMNIYFSIQDKKQKKKYLYILGAAGRLYESFCYLRKIKVWMKLKHRGLISTVL